MVRATPCLAGLALALAFVTSPPAAGAGPSGRRDAPPPPAAGALGGDLLWSQVWDGWSAYGPSVRNEVVDREIADDFAVHALITGVEATGTRGFNPPPSPSFTGVEVRFYEVGSDGAPGDVQAEYVLLAGDPDLVYDPVDPSTFEITLDPPFQATGAHFLGVQAVMESAWYRPSANHYGPKRGSPIWIRDDLAGGQWQPYEEFGEAIEDDIAFRLYGTLTAAPVITALSEASVTRSGRLRVLGDNLGGTQNGGEVWIDGLPAIVAEWTDVAIHAYVPEEADLGEVTVAVTTTAGSSVPEILEVTARQQVGRRRWRFTCDAQAIAHRPGIGPDGTVYAQDTEAILYAIAPDGALRWLLDLGDEGGTGPVVVGPDGTIFAAVDPLGPAMEIWAVNPDGTMRWVFRQESAGTLLSGPGLGPDGNLYAVADFVGEGFFAGAFSLDAADGSLRWLNPGDPVLHEHGPIGTEIAFGADRFYVAFDERAVHTSDLLFGFDIDGNQLFAVGQPWEDPQAVVDADGNVAIETWLVGGGIRLSSYDPEGNLRWIAFGSPTNVLSHPAAGPDGSLYAVRNLYELWSLASADGSASWLATSDQPLGHPIVSPDGRTLLTDAGGFGAPYAFRAFDAAAQGALLWEEPLGLEADGTVVGPSARVLFTADGTVAYGAGRPLVNPEHDRHCYLYALETARHDPLFADGFESGDTGAWDVVSGE